MEGYGYTASKPAPWQVTRSVLVIGQLAMASGLLYLSQASVDAAYWTDLFPGFVGIGVGIGLSAVAVQVAAFTGVEPAISGLAGGMLETAREVGGVVGVAVVATVAIAPLPSTSSPQTAGRPATRSTAGFERATLVAAGISVVAARSAQRSPCGGADVPTARQTKPPTPSAARALHRRTHMPDTTTFPTRRRSIDDEVAARWSRTDER